MSYRWKNNCFEQLFSSANDPYHFWKDLGKLIFRVNFRILIIFDEFIGVSVCNNNLSPFF